MKINIIGDKRIHINKNSQYPSSVADLLQSRGGDVGGKERFSDSGNALGQTSLTAEVRNEGSFQVCKISMNIPLFPFSQIDDIKTFIRQKI